jgi:transposase
MFLPYHQNLNFLFPRALSEFVPVDHQSRIISDIIDQMDLSSFYARYSGMGPAAYHPKMMLKVILYGFTEGIFSSRKLAKACEESLPFLYLSGLQTPVYRTFIEFRERHREGMETVFKETVLLARTMGLAKLGNVAMDGTKVLSDTSKHKAMSYGRMQEEEERLKSEIDFWMKKAEEEDSREAGMPEKSGSLPAALADGNARKETIIRAKEEIALREEKRKKIQTAKAELEKREAEENPGKAIENTKQISFADPEARVFSKKSEGTEYVYNAQVAVDMGSQIILGTTLINTVSDSRAVEGMLEKIKETAGERPEMLVADAGYGNVHTLEACEKAGVIPVVATARERKKAEGEEEAPPLLSGFVLEETEGSLDTLRCSHGILFVWIYSSFGKKRTYRAVEEECACGCPEELRVEETAWARFKLRQKQKENEAVYRRRKTTVEPVFGQIKSGMGFVHFFCRGLEKVQSEWNLVCGAFNLKKLMAWKQRLVNGPAPEGAGRDKKRGTFPKAAFPRGLFPGMMAENAL